MTMDIAAYLTEVTKIYATGQATEHSYRPALEKLFKSIDQNVNAVNEPKGVKVGRPDFVFIREAGKHAQVTVGHCEAKDIGLGINPKGMNDFNKAQHDRYVKALPNLVYTNGLDFRFYKKGELTCEISIGDVLMGIQPKPDQFQVLVNQLKDFAAEKLQTITSAKDLAKMMAGKARLIKDILFNSLKEDIDQNTDLVGQYQSFKKMLIHDLTSEDFSDIYAETVAYGMFGARLHDKTLENFSRAEALELMPKSNPFLRYLFTYIAGILLAQIWMSALEEPLMSWLKFSKPPTCLCCLKILASSPSAMTRSSISMKRSSPNITQPSARRAACGIRQNPWSTSLCVRWMMF